jgi:hypothetical protein
MCKQRSQSYDIRIDNFSVNVVVKYMEYFFKKKKKILWLFPNTYPTMYLKCSLAGRNFRAGKLKSLLSL